MTRKSSLIFAWKKCIFIAYIYHTELFLKWRNVDSSSLSSDEEETDKHDNDNNSGSSDCEYDVMLLENSPPKFKLKENNSGAQESNKTSLNVSRWKYCEVVTGGCSFDEGCFQRAPVLLLKCGNPKNDESGKMECQLSQYQYEYVIVQVKDIGSDFMQTSQFDTKDIRSAEFKLVPIRSYSLNTDCDFTHFKSYPVFLSGLQLLLVNSDPHSAPFKFFAQDRFSSHNLIKDFDFADSYKNISDVQVLDAFSVLEDKTLITIISFKTDEGLTKCLSLQFSPNLVMKSHLATENYDMVQVPVDMLFAPDFAEILKVVNISTFASNYNLISKSHSFRTSVVMVTHTGYALRFNDGALCCCVNLVDHSKKCGLDQENWNSAIVKIINFDGCPDRTAVQVNSVCYLIDWTKEKIVRSWLSVLKAVSCDVLVCGVSSLVLVFESQNTHFSDALNSRQLLEELQIRVVDVDDECQRDDKNDDHRGIPVDSDVIKRHSDDESVSQPQCALNALLGQRKKCEQAVAEVKSELGSKISFLYDTWQQLSNLQIQEVNRPAPRQINCHQLPLAVLVEGSLPSFQDSQDPLQPAKKYLEIGSVWKRVVDSMLVVGAPVRNVSDSTLTDIFLNIIPGTLCHTDIFQTTSACRRQTLNTEPDFSSIPIESVSSLQKKAKSFRFSQGLEVNRECLLPPGQTTVATCTLDITQALSAADFTCHVFLNYLVLIDGSCSPGEDGFSGRDVEEYCTELVITSNELINETYSLGVLLETPEKLTTLDLFALDSVQKSMVLVVQSVVSSVTCLSFKLTNHPAIRYLEWAEQFLIVTSQWLKFCRIQVLEQYSKNRGKIKVFARSHSEALMLIKFLYSLLPKDVTITPDKSSNLSLVTLVGQTVLQDVERRISSVKHQIESITDVVPTGEGTVPQPGSLSPTFHATKSLRKISVNARSESCIKTSVADSSSSKPAEIGGERGGVVKERELFRRAKKRFREIWGDEDSSESG